MVLENAWCSFGIFTAASSVGLVVIYNEQEKKQIQKHARIETGAAPRMLLAIVPRNARRSSADEIHGVYNKVWSAECSVIREYALQTSGWHLESSTVSHCFR